MTHASDALYQQIAEELGIAFEDEIRAGANYEVAVENDGEIWVSGQIPRMQGKIVVTGRAGGEVSLEEARRASQVSIMRALAILRQSLGSLGRVKRVLRMTVYVQSAADFTMQSEVADAASEILYKVFAPNGGGGHTRTSVGVYQLPKNAVVEIDLVAALNRVS
ncbi:MAG TPA: RidA family protein [Noviherbaspirillum sp.]|nr:RidA family protein [Noviherbaspirillum sp.]